MSNDGEDFLALLVFVPGIANAVTAFFSHRVGAIPMQHAQIELVVLRQMPHAGDEGMLKGAVVRPSGEDFVDGGVMDFRCAVVVFGRKYSGNPSLPSEKTGLSKKSCYNLAHGKHSATTHLRR